MTDVRDTVTAVVKFEMDPELFKASYADSYKQSLAQAAGVDVDMVTLSLSPGSVVVTAIIKEVETLTATQLQADLQASPAAVLQSNATPEAALLLSDLGEGDVVRLVSVCPRARASQRTWRTFGIKA